MRNYASTIVTAGVAVLATLLVGNRISPAQAQGQQPRFAAVPSEKGGQDIFGGYDIVRDWPKPLGMQPGHEQWTWGAGQGVFAETPNRVFVLQRGELPNIQRPRATKLTQLGPSVEFPIGRLPWRDATSASPPGALFAADGKTPGNDLDVGTPGVDYRWEHIIKVVDASGNYIEDWSQWDKMFRRPHSVYQSPYDPQRNVWIVDDYRHAIFQFSNDGKRLLKTIGEPNVPGSDDRHFYRPTFMAFTPDFIFVADGYANTRVVKLDKDGKYLMAWGQRGENGKETRPGYLNNVHGVAVDVPTRRVFVNDRGNRRIQVFDFDGKFLDQWSIGQPPSDIHLVFMDGSRSLWAFDRASSKMIKYDLNGNFMYSWGTWGDFPGGFWGVHGVHVDSDGNFYVAEVDNGGVQKFRPRAGANPVFLLTRPAPVRAAVR